MKGDKSIRQGARIPYFTRRSFFSLKAHNRLVRFANAILNLKLVPGDALDLQITDDNAVATIPAGSGASPAVPSAFWHPFKIYTDPTASVPASSFAVRAGYIGFRSRFNAEYDWDVEYAELFGRAYERQYLVQDGTDRFGGVPYFNFASAFVDTGYATEVLNVTGSATFTGIGKSLFVIDLATAGNYSDTGYLAVGFWILITDSPDPDTSPKFEVQCRLFGFSGNLSGFATAPWPSSTNDTMIIPIGYALTAEEGSTPVPGVPTNGSFIINQRLYDHQVNSIVFPTATPGGGGFGMGAWRGDWDTDSLAGQVFYPGDLFTFRKDFGPAEEQGLLILQVPSWTIITADPLTSTNAIAFWPD